MSDLWDRMRSAAAGEWERSSRPPQTPLEWAADHGIHWWSMQERVALALEETKRVCVQSGAGIGKSFTAASLAVRWVSTHPASDVFVMTTAPSADQVHGILWEEIRKLHTSLRLPGEAQQTDRWVIGGQLVAQGRKPPDYSATSGDGPPSTGQGFHREYTLVILDEAGGLPDWLWDMAENITTGDSCRILAIGNPDDPNSKFARICAGHPLWRHFQVSVFDSPNFTGEPVPDVVRRQLTSRQWADDRLAEWGADDPRYVSKVLGLFPPSHPRQVILASDLAACQLAEPRAAADLLPVVLGVDVGGGGDETVIRERRGVRAGRQWCQRSEQPEQISRLVLAAIRETGATAVNVDAIGVGFNVVGELRNMRARGEHGAEVHAVKVSEAASDPATYHNLRAQIWWEVGRVGSQQREWDLSVMEDADRTIAQLTGPRWFEDVKGRVQIERKEDLIARTGRSPDQADALLLAFMQARRSPQDAYWRALTSGRL